MKPYFRSMFTLFAPMLLALSAAYAAEEGKLVVAIATDSFELPETDISALAIGEAKTIETGSGQVVDILRTRDGAEIYVDGELLDMDFGHADGEHDLHVTRHQVEVTCSDADESECEKHVEIQIHGDGGLSGWTEAEGDAGLRHELEINCDDEDGTTTCEQHVIRIGDGDVINIEEMHEEHSEGKTHKLIVIRKDSDTDD